ncbi:MAG: NUDIX hydrolase [Pseudomonadota bacterium]
MIKPWKTLGSKLTYKDDWLTVRSHRLEQPNGTILDPFHVIEGSEWVCICALTDDGQVLAIREFRVGANAVTLGLVGGGQEPSDSDALSAARRELAEETGYVADELVQIGRAYANWANQDNQISYFLGFGAKPTTQQKLDIGEDIEPVLVPYHEFLAYDFEGPKQTHHAAALFYAERYFKRHPERRPK